MSSDVRGQQSDLRVWVDAQLPPALATWLAREHGMDAVHVEDLGLLEAADRTIYHEARGAGRVVVVTTDQDFQELLEVGGPPPQVVWLTCGNVTNAELRRIVDATWPRVVGLIEAGEPLVEVRSARD